MFFVGFCNGLKLQYQTTTDAAGCSINDGKKGKEKQATNRCRTQQQPEKQQYHWPIIITMTIMIP